MRLSRAGLAFLTREEGLRLEPYNDSAGHATIGVGHLIHRGPVTEADRRRYAGFDRVDAMELLRRDVRSREQAVERLVTVPLNQNEFDALVSLVFNIGEGAFTSSTVLRRLNTRDREGAADAFLLWRVGGPGLIHRRKRERELFLAPPSKLARWESLQRRDRRIANARRRKDLVAWPRWLRARVARRKQLIDREERRKR